MVEKIPEKCLEYVATGKYALKEHFGEEEEEEEEFTPVDLAISLMLLGLITFVMGLFYLVNHPDEDSDVICSALTCQEAPLQSPAVKPFGPMGLFCFI